MAQEKNGIKISGVYEEKASKQVVSEQASERRLVGE